MTDVGRRGFVVATTHQTLDARDAHSHNGPLAQAHPLPLEADPVQAPLGWWL